MSNIFSSLQAETEKQKQQLAQRHSPTSPTAPNDKENSASEPTQTATQERDIMREMPRDTSREIPRELPTRDEIQEFSFRLRDSLKVKVQAEVPHEWQQELEGLARQLDVKKLELYRFILGEFLGKVSRTSSMSQEAGKEPKQAY